MKDTKVGEQVRDFGEPQTVAVDSPAQRVRHRAPRRTKIPEPGEDAILVDGVGQLCADLGIEPTDVVMLVLAWHFQAMRMCEFTRAQFVDGLTKLGYGRLPPPPAPAGKDRPWVL